MAKGAELMASEEKKEAVKAKQEEAFKAADADGDGVLTLEEYTNYVKLTIGRAKEAGWHVNDFTDEQLELSWNITKSAEGGDKGVTLGAMRAVQAQVMKAMQGS